MHVAAQWNYAKWYALHLSTCSSSHSTRLRRWLGRQYRIYCSYALAFCGGCCCCGSQSAACRHLRLRYLLAVTPNQCACVCVCWRLSVRKRFAVDVLSQAGSSIGVASFAAQSLIRSSLNAHSFIHTRPYTYVCVCVCGTEAIELRCSTVACTCCRCSYHICCPCLLRCDVFAVIVDFAAVVVVSFIVNLMSFNWIAFALCG